MGSDAEDLASYGVDERSAVSEKALSRAPCMHTINSPWTLLDISVELLHMVSKLSKLFFI